MLRVFAAAPNKKNYLHFANAMVKRTNSVKTQQRAFKSNVDEILGKAIETHWPKLQGQPMDLSVIEYSIGFLFEGNKDHITRGLSQEIARFEPIKIPEIDQALNLALYVGCLVDKQPIKEDSRYPLINAFAVANRESTNNRRPALIGHDLSVLQKLVAFQEAINAERKLSLRLNIDKLRTAVQNPSNSIRQKTQLGFVKEVFDIDSRM